MFPTLSSAASASLKRAFGHEELVQWKIPAELSHGDATTTVSLSLGKKLGKSPRDIADVLVKDLGSLPEVTKIEIAGAGYVNVWLTPESLLSNLSSTRQSLQRQPSRGEAPIVVDYSSPNIAKPLGIHHILSTVIGQVVTNLHEHNGEQLVRWNYIGDWGTQFGKLAVAYQNWGTPQKPASQYTLDEFLELYVLFHEKAETDDTLEAAGQEAFKKLEAGDQALRAFWSDVVAVTQAAMGDIYKRLHVQFDVVRGESYYEDKMRPIIEEGKQKGLFVEGEKGSIIVEFPDHEQWPPAVVVKSDGATLYLTRDLALMKDRIENFHPKAILWAVDIAQALYFQQLFETAKKLGWNLPYLEHIAFGRMRFADRSMSTRKGNIVKLEHVLDEAVARARETIRTHRESIEIANEDALAETMGVGALVYGVLSQNRKQDMIFDWAKMLSFDGNSAPYLMYTHARARSILRKSEMKLDPAGSITTAPATLSDRERALVRALLQFPEALNDARETAMPHTLANSLYALCQEFNQFYHAENILKTEDAQLKNFRLSLTALTASVLRTGASLLTLVLPDQM